MKQRDIIYKYLELRNEWTPSFELIKNVTPFGFIGSGSDRIARYMVKEGLLDRKLDKKYSYYRLHKKQQELI